MHVRLSPYVMCSTLYEDVTVLVTQLQHIIHFNVRKCSSVYNRIDFSCCYHDESISYITQITQECHHLNHYKIESLECTLEYYEYLTRALHARTQVHFPE